MAIPGSLWILFVLILLQGCSVDYEQLAVDRAEYAKENQGDIVIVAIEEPVKSNYLKGIQLAVQQINGRPNKLLGRPLKLMIEQGEPTFEDNLSTLRTISANPKVTAVLGHRSSRIAVPASVIYEKSQIVFLPPFSTVKELTNHNFKFVFRMMPNNLVMAEQLASVAHILGYQKMISLYAHTDYYRKFAFTFEDAAIKKNIDFDFRRAFTEYKEDYRSLISQFRNKKFDAIFLSTGNESSIRIIQQLRAMGIDVPILSGDGINSQIFSQTQSSSTNNTIMPTVYHTEGKTIINQTFKTQYKKTYSSEADYNAAQGYDSVMLLVAAIDKAQSTLPTTLASTLRYLPYWAGVTGLHAFNDQGEILGKHYFFQVMKNHQWHPIPNIYGPYTLEKFKQRRSADKRKVPITPFPRQFSQQLHAYDLRKTQLDLVHEILEYKRLGWIYDEGQSEIISSEKKWLQALARKKRFTLRSCGIHFSTLNSIETEKQLIQCYGKLATSVDAIYITVSPNMDQPLMKRLNQSLHTYQVPVLAFQADNEVLNMGLTLKLSRAGVKSHTPDSIGILSGILTKIKAFELSDKLSNMPKISADLKLLTEYGKLHSKDLLTLAPHPSGE